MRIAFRLALLAAVFCGSAAAVSSQVRAGEDRFVGEAQRYSSGAGLVIAIGVQRR